MQHASKHIRMLREMNMYTQTSLRRPQTWCITGYVRHSLTENFLFTHFLLYDLNRTRGFRSNGSTQSHSIKVVISPITCRNQEEYGCKSPMNRELLSALPHS